MLYEFNGKKPNIDPEVLIQDGVKIEGDVTIKNGASIWYNSTIRADINKVVIGECSNVQELTTIHVDFDCPTIVGNFVTIGHNCVLHGCEIGNGSLIGMGSIVLNNAKIGENCLVGAGSVVGQNFTCEDNMLIIGNPATAKRLLKPHELEYIKKNTLEYVEFAKKHR